MRNLFRFIFKHYLFWILFFMFFKLLFLASLYPFSFKPGIDELLMSLIAGIQLDISTATYLFMLPFILLILRITGAIYLSEIVIKVYFTVIIFLMTLLTISNILIFKFWGTLLNNRALAYVSQPREMLASVTNFQLFFLILIFSILFLIIYKAHRVVVINSFGKINVRPFAGIATLMLLLPITVIGLRGGLQLIPVNESSAVYSSHYSLNQAATNPVWYLGHNLLQAGFSEKNPYEFMDTEMAKSITKNVLHKNPNDTATIFNFSGKPNIVIILLESWTADIIEPLDGIKAVTPNFTSLASEGLLFSSVYSSGFRTDQALISVLSGYPSQPNKSIIRFPAKASALPSVSEEFKNLGYNNSFYYGGELGFANMNNYLVNSGFDKIISIEDFGSNNMNSKWGAHDEFVFEKQLLDLNKTEQPFLSALLTLSTHEPFEVPLNTPFNDEAESEQFKKSAWYTDYCLGEYFRKAKKTPWYNNTIFVFMADHGHRLPLNREYIDPNLRRIPLLIVSELLKNEYKGTSVGNIANQHDFASTLLKNLNISDSAFTWSVNIMDTTRSNFAFLSLDMAFTWHDERQTLVIPLQAGMKNFGNNNEQVSVAKAYLQHLYQTFTDY